MSQNVSPLFVLSLSGGLDSTALCASLLAEYGSHSVLPVFFYYGSKHNELELEAAQKVSAYYQLSLTQIDLSATFRHVSSALLTDDVRGIPKSTYNLASMQLTAVPGRNLIFASILAAIAESHKIPNIALATHGGDHHIYPDCRPSFNSALRHVVGESTENHVDVVVPFEMWTKSDIVKLGIDKAAPFHLTRSCYEQTALSCGLCGTCRERLAAFNDHGIKDPIPYS